MIGTAYGRAGPFSVFMHLIEEMNGGPQTIPIPMFCFPKRKKKVVLQPGKLILKGCSEIQFGLMSQTPSTFVKKAS